MNLYYLFNWAATDLLTYCVYIKECGKFYFFLTVFAIIKLSYINYINSKNVFNMK